MPINYVVMWLNTVPLKAITFITFISKALCPGDVGICKAVRIT